MKIRISKKLTTKKIIEKYGVSRITAWRAKKRGYLHTNYHHGGDTTLFVELPEKDINRAVEKYGKPLEKLLQNRKFKSGEKIGYYKKCLISLCSELERKKK